MRSTTFFHTASFAILLALPLAAEDKPADPAADRGAKVYLESCQDCHKGKTSIDHLRMTRAKWKEAVDRMIETSLLDPPPSKEKINLLLDWLARTKGPAEDPPAEKK